MATVVQGEGGGVRLADESPFRLGLLAVVPALRQVRWAGEQRTLEPRVMQVLVALGREPGAIVSRDALVERCWDGRIVGENAIQRTISLLRHLAVESEAFEIETITKVGYRLKPRGVSAPDPAPAPGASPPAHLPSRRSLLAGVGAAIVAVGGGALWVATPSAKRREAERLHAAALAVRNRGDESSVRQAVSFLERAVAADHSFAPGWGDLALRRIELIESLAEPDHPPVLASVRQAADRALALDPDNREALLALAVMRPNFRNWVEVDRDLRAALHRLPDEPQLHERLGMLHMDTGRTRAAVREFRWLWEREPLVPANQVQLARAYAAAGDASRASALLETARQHHPINSVVWLARFDHLLRTGRGSAVLAMTDGPRVGFGGQSPLSAEVGLAVARAAADGRDASRAKAVAEIVESRRIGRVASTLAIPYLVLLGAVEPAWEAIYTYYVGRRDPDSGERQPLPPVAWRRTDFLFSPTLAPLRSDPRFPKLTAALGLDAYWRATGTRPDLG